MNAEKIAYIIDKTRDLITENEQLLIKNEDNSLLQEQTNHLIDALDLLTEAWLDSLDFAE